MEMEDELDEMYISKDKRPEDKSFESKVFVARSNPIKAVQQNENIDYIPSGSIRLTVAKQKIWLIK